MNQQRSQPKRRKQATPRRVVATSEDQTDGDDRKVKPLKVILSNKDTDEEMTVKTEDEIKIEPGTGRKKARKSSDAEP